ncbi:MAG: prolyl aminopeptidase [Gammaproteobacteria bacterium]|nr:prolyl aminopeptidase [Gammaproteobacteria bacterium]
MPLTSLLYPPIEPYTQHCLQVDSTHSLHIEECGNPQGIPVIFVHGGPGSGYSAIHRQFFNPAEFRIILFDQRGCGQSKPHASLTNNTTAHLIEDMDKIRRHLNIDKWVLFGGSWGSTLSLLYAQSFPERVYAMVLRGIFLCRKQDVDWFYQSGADRFFPEYWADFIAPVAPENRHNLIGAYHQLLTSHNEIERMRAAEAWSVWEGRTSNLKTDPNVVNHFGDPFHALAMARIECHYFHHQAFIEENQILENCEVINAIPTTIVHGRYDMVCPINQAFDLHEQLPNAQLIINSHAGHSAMELENARALVAATDLLTETLVIA